MDILGNVMALIALTGFRCAVAWDYGLNGADWSEQGMCGKGGFQSPVDLPMSAATDDELTMFLKYPKLNTAVTVYHNGKSIAFTLPESFRAGFGVGKGSDGVKAFESDDADAYRLWQVNFHSPSEHTIDGERMPLEMQMMHQQVTGGSGLAVVVVLFNAAPNAYGPLLDGVLGEGLPTNPFQEAVRKPPLEFAPLLGGSAYYKYEGSLTVPPCEQQVKYFVRRDPVPAAHAQLREFSKVLQDTCRPKGNYRLVHELQGTVSLVGSVDAVNSPNDVASPVVAKLPGEMPPPPTECTDPNFFDDAWKNLNRIRVGETAEVTAAKTQYNKAHLDLQANGQAIASSARNVKTLERLYENTPGPVEKINMMWQLKAAKEVEAGAKAGMGDKVEAVEQAGKVLLAALDKMCQEIMLKNRPEAESQAEAKSAPEKLKEKAARHFDYPGPHVKLPLGLGGSPFSDKEPNGEDVVMSDKIAVNLQQPDAPPSAATEEAQGNLDKVQKGEGSQEMILEMRLPMAPEVAFHGYAVAGNLSTFSRNLVKALASITRLSESRFELKEIRKVPVQQISTRMANTQSEDTQPIYLPKARNGDTVLVKETGSTWRAVKPPPTNMVSGTAGLGYRTSKEQTPAPGDWQVVSHAHTSNAFLPWGQTMDGGVDEGDGWVRFAVKAPRTKKFLQAH